ncbi:MAG TPA: response regulator [Alphaproteobacteria bacterium]|nr:response regulator [Alphaproteobacteria bacterium]
MNAPTATAAQNIAPSAQGASFFTPREQKPLLLLVDDARVMRAVLQETLEKKGYQILVAENGEDAIDLLTKYATRIDAVVLDREMPGIDGLEVVKRMKEDFQMATIPVIMFTATSAPEKIQEGIDAGVFYYLVKPADEVVLQRIIDSALRESKQKHSLITELSLHSGMLKTLRSCQLSLRSLTEAEDAACLLAACFPNPERVVTGFMELLVNAVEHGNLNISYEEKHKLLTENNWREEVDRRLALPENASKTVEVTFQRKDGDFLAQITDAGPGFDWKRYWHINPSRATASHGRGIARARLMSFDRMS